jgi:hypothetical protein
MEHYVRQPRGDKMYVAQYALQQLRVGLMKTWWLWVASLTPQSASGEFAYGRQK